MENRKPTENEQREAIRAYWREYRNRPDVKEKRRAYQRDYMRRKRAEAKATAQSVKE